MQMMKHGARLWIALVLLALAGPSVPAAEARDYSYLFLQGRLSTAKGSEPVSGAIIRFSAGDVEFVVESNRQGTFAFEKLPVQNYKVEIIAPDGATLRGYQKTDPLNTKGVRVRLKRRKGAGEPIRIEVAEQRVEFFVPEIADNWKKFWVEGAIFLAIAALFAL